MISVTADVVLFSDEDDSHILLIRRKNPPFAGQWAFPGGFVNEDEYAHDAAIRELWEETGINIAGRCSNVPEFLADRPDRDPRGRVISVVYTAFIPREEPTAGDDAAHVEWVPLKDLQWSGLAFDHEAILTDIIERLDM